MKYGSLDERQESSGEMRSKSGVRFVLVGFIKILTMLNLHVFIKLGKLKDSHACRSDVVNDRRGGLLALAENEVPRYASAEWVPRCAPTASFSHKCASRERMIDSPAMTRRDLLAGPGRSLSRSHARISPSRSTDARNSPRYREREALLLLSVRDKMPSRNAREHATGDTLIALHMFITYTTRVKRKLDVGSSRLSRRMLLFRMRYYCHLQRRK